MSMDRLAAAVSRGARTIAVPYASSLTVSLTRIDQINIGVLTGPLTLTLTDGDDAQPVRIRFMQDATGGRVLTLAASFRLCADLPNVVLSTGANKTDYLGVLVNAIAGKYDVVSLMRGF